MHARRLGDAGPGEVRVSAPQLFLGAGCIGTCEMLLRNARVHGTLTRLSPRLGSRYGTNGDRLGLAAMARPGQPDLGPTNTWGVEFAGAGGRPEILVIDGGYPHPFVMGALALLDALGVRGPRVTSGLIRAQRWVQRHITRRLAVLSPLPLLGMNAESGMEGRMSLDRRRRLVLDLGLADNAGPDARMDARMGQMAAVVAPRGRVRGAIARFYLRLPGRAYRLLGKTEVPHNLGGAPMGATAADGVVSHCGAVHGCPGMHVVDGSVLPPAIGRNPLATIAALAERSMAHVLLADNRRLLSEGLERLLAGVPGDAGPAAVRAHATRRIDAERERLRLDPLAAAPTCLWKEALERVRRVVDDGGDPAGTGHDLLRRALAVPGAMDPDG